VGNHRREFARLHELSRRANGEGKPLNKAEKREYRDLQVRRAKRLGMGRGLD
jgi:hypothetical protein